MTSSRASRPRRGWTTPCQRVKRRASVALLDGLDFLAELGEGFAADGAQDFGVAPLAMDAAGAEAAFDDAAEPDEALEDGFDASRAGGRSAAATRRW